MYFIKLHLNIFLANLGGTEIFVILFLLLLLIIPNAFYCITLKKTLNEISRPNRKMAPNDVWFLLIPVVSLVWSFFVVNKMTQSLQLEFERRNIKRQEDKPGYNIGLTYCILACCVLIPLIGPLLSIAGFVCWIVYWVKINEFYNLLKKHGNNDSNEISEIGKNIV